MIVLVGSRRPAKVEGLRDALESIGRIDPRFRAATLQPHDLTHIAPRMPMSLDEILDGARRRARALLSLAPRRADAAGLPFAVGLEGGLHRLPGGDGAWSLQTWAAVTNGTSWGYGGGPSVVVPPWVAARVSAGDELGDVIDELAGAGVRGTRGAWGVLTLDLIDRRDAFRLAAIAAFTPFFHGAAWTSPTGDVHRLDP